MEALKIIGVIWILAFAVYGLAAAVIGSFNLFCQKEEEEPLIVPVGCGVSQHTEGSGLRSFETEMKRQKDLADVLIEEKRLANQKKKIELAESVVLATANIVKALAAIGARKPEPSVLPWEIKKCDTCPGEYQEVCLRVEYADVGLFTFASVAHNVEADAVQFYKEKSYEASQHKYEIRQLEKDEEGVTVVVRMSRVREGSDAERFTFAQRMEAKAILRAHGLNPDLFENGGCKTDVMKFGQTRVVK